VTDPLTHLTAALDAAQRDAEAARDAHCGVYASTGDAEWYYDPTDGIFTKPHGIQVTPGVPYVDPDVEPHLARHDPQATLRRIAAERKTLALHQSIPGSTPDGDGTVCGECANVGREEVEGEPYPCPTVRNMAEGYGWSEETP
jgi:hypothetical protein